LQNRCNGITFKGDAKCASPDTASTVADNSIPQSSPVQDTSKPAADLMTPMNNSMAKMKSMQMTGDFDIDFANMMIDHHQGGIDMAQIEVTQGKDDKIKSKAQEILTKQQEEQQKLRDFVASYKPSGMKHGEGDLQKSMSTMESKMKTMQMTGNIDKDFATMMRSHHEDGIAMAKLEVKNGMSGDLKKMAQKLINEQQKDNKELQSWLSTQSNK
jgi:uncharacterized protein (DUF305 family)